jgi:hypothetical protein
MRELTGKRFGLLSVVGRGEPIGSRATWRVRCLCGSEERTVREDHLLAERTKSCGCASSKMRKSKMEKRFNLVNQRFGDLLVVWRVDSQKVGDSSHACWACKCACGAVVEVSAKALANGKTSCGHPEPGVFVVREAAAV